MTFIRRRSLMLAAAILLAGCAQKVQQIRLAPTLPAAGKSAVGRVIALGKLEDARGPAWNGAKVAEWVPSGGEKYKTTHVIDRPVAELMRNLVGDVLENAGYSVLRVPGDEAGRMPMLTGSIGELKTEFHPGAMMGNIESRIRLTLTLARPNGNSLEETFTVEHLRHAGNLEPEAFELVTDEALSRLLVKVAVFVDSDRFRAALPQK